MTVLTVTLNPAIDQTVALERLTPGSVHRAKLLSSDAAGKGINVASCLADWGMDVVATGLLGAENAASFEDLLVTKGIADAFVRAPGRTRTNIKLVDRSETTDLNFLGLEATGELLEAVARAVRRNVTPGTLAVLAGSLPDGCPPDHYARMIAEIAAQGGRVLLDTSGPALAHALAAPVRPFAVKPNCAELAEWAGEPLDDHADMATCAQRLQGMGIPLVVVSMGADGALFVTDDGVVRAHLPMSNVASTVGAGDAMVAGIAAALSEGGDLARIARLSTAFAGAKLRGSGSHLRDLNEVRALAAGVTLTTLKTVRP